MFDEKMLCRLLDENVCDGKCRMSCVKRELSKKQRRIENLLGKKDGCAFAQNSFLGEWIYMNFPRVREKIKDIKMSGFTEKCGKMPRFFKVFTGCIRKKPRLDSREITQLFSCINIACKIDFTQNAFLEKLFEAAVLSEILDTFEIAEVKENADVLTTIESLFFTLDELLFFDSERVLENNCIEKILLCDPSGDYKNLTSATTKFTA